MEIKKNEEQTIPVHSDKGIGRGRSRKKGGAAAERKKRPYAVIILVILLILIAGIVLLDYAPDSISAVFIISSL